MPSLSPATYQASAASLSCFLKGRATGGDICGLSGRWLRPALCARSRDVCQSLLSPLLTALTGTQPHWGYLRAGQQDLQARPLQWIVGGLLDGVHNAANQVCLSLVPFKSPICCSTSLFLPPSHAAHNAALWTGQERNGAFGSIEHSWGMGEAHSTLSLSPTGEIMLWNSGPQPP